jgi:hypothetical protein
MNTARFIAIIGLSLAAAACGDADQFDLDATEEASATDFEYAPDDLDEEAIIDAKAEDEADLTGKGSMTLPRGRTFYTPVTIANNQTVSWYTTDGSTGVDTVLVLFRRHDNSSTFVSSPWTAKIGLQTLAVDDDGGAGRYSSLSYKNTSGRTENAWLMGFAYNSSTGTARINGTINYGIRSFTAGGLPRSSTAGQAYTTGGGDPVLFAFDRSAGLGNGAWNDDDPIAGGLESRIQGLTNLSMWLVPVAIGSRPTGTSTVYY